nr:MAG TPA: hypothetical protein [Caudoviricetes sp.]
MPISKFTEYFFFRRTIFIFPFFFYTRLSSE